MKFKPGDLVIIIDKWCYSRGELAKIKRVGENKDYPYGLVLVNRNLPAINYHCYGIKRDLDEIAKEEDIIFGSPEMSALYKLRQ